VNSRTGRNRADSATKNRPGTGFPGNRRTGREQCRSRREAVGTGVRTSKSWLLDTVESGTFSAPPSRRRQRTSGWWCKRPHNGSWRDRAPGRSPAERPIRTAARRAQRTGPAEPDDQTRPRTSPPVSAPVVERTMPAGPTRERRARLRCPPLPTPASSQVSTARLRELWCQNGLFATPSAAEREPVTQFTIARGVRHERLPTLLNDLLITASIGAVASITGIH
jgi:hypothetical protein